MIIRILIIMKRSVQSRTIPIVTVPNIIINKPSLESLLESNIENLKYAFRSRLDTLGEEDEMLESSQTNNSPMGKRRISNVLASIPEDT